MFGPKELDLRNIYNPNLQDILESAERTYGEANSFYRKEELYLKDVERRILNGELSDEKEIYDECHAIASDLAKCCEVYLKALFIYENNIPGNEIDELWDKLKKYEYMTDKHGTLLYKTFTGIITFAKYDVNGNACRDKNGKIIYYDKDGNVYNDNNKGSRIKRNGHQLDRLIGLLSPESSLLLETRMLTIPMETTENNSTVSIFDVLLKNGVISKDKEMSSEQYVSWIDQHKKTFEESRYSGEKKYDVNVEFLYHLATQIRAVVQYRMAPKQNQHFTITEDELKSLPEEVKQFAISHSCYLSEELMKAIANDENIKNKIKRLFPDKSVLLPKNISSKDFYSMITLMNYNEIIYSSYLCYILQNFDKLNLSETIDNVDEDIERIFKIASIFKSNNFNSAQVIGLFVQIKLIFKNKLIIENDSIEMLLQVFLNKIRFEYNAFKNMNQDFINKKSNYVDNDYIYMNDYKYKF